MEKRKFGDRKDAKRIRNVQSMNQIMIDLKPNRNLGEVYVNQKIDVTNLMEYYEECKKKNPNDNITLFHMFAMAIAKTIYNRPLLNRFVANRHVYEHNEIIISFVAKVEFNDSSEEVMVIVPIKESDTLKDVSNKIKNKVEEIRNKKNVKEGANSAIDILGKLPNILRIPIVGIFKWCDKKGILPASLVKDNIYYSSIIVSNLGVLKVGGIYHNITDFGTCSGLVTIGEVKKEYVFDENGKKAEKYYCEFGITIDERIADGFYLIKSVHLIEKILNDPKLLEERVNEKIKND